MDFMRADTVGCRRLHACPKEELKKAHRVAENTLARPIEVSAIEGVKDAVQAGMGLFVAEIVQECLLKSRIPKYRFEIIPARGDWHALDGMYGTMHSNCAGLGRNGDLFGDAGEV
jgi:hypothetical protein